MPCTGLGTACGAQHPSQQLGERRVTPTSSFSGQFMVSQLLHSLCNPLPYPCREPPHRHGPIPKSSAPQCPGSLLA